VPTNGRMSIDDPFILGFRDGNRIQERNAEPAGDDAWSFASDRAWLAVPLSHRQEVVGFVVLDRPSQRVTPDWEAFDLLRLPDGKRPVMSPRSARRGSCAIRNY
jgi:hypothetical protein